VPKIRPNAGTERISRAGFSGLVARTGSSTSTIKTPFVTVLAAAAPWITPLGDSVPKALDRSLVLASADPMAAPSVTAAIPTPIRFVVLIGARPQTAKHALN
jgi:hypothetical protein